MHSFSPKNSLFLVVLTVMFGRSVTLLVTIGGKGKPIAKQQFQTVIPCTTDDDCQALQNTTCVETNSSSFKSCRCEDMELPIQRQCLLLRKDLSSACIGADDCYSPKQIHDSVDCVESRCKCKLGYFVDEVTASCREIQFTAFSESLAAFHLCLLLLTSCLAVLFLYKLVCLIRLSSKSSHENKLVY